MAGEDQVAALVVAGKALECDVYCIECEYNLRGLMPEGRCPECGKGIAATLERERLLRTAGWRPERLTRGLWLLIGSQVLAMGLALLLLWLKPGVRSGPRPVNVLNALNSHESWTALVMYLDSYDPAVLVTVVPLAIQLAGMWLVSSRVFFADSAGRRDVRWWLPRLYLTTAVAAVVFAFAQWVAPGLRYPWLSAAVAILVLLQFLVVVLLVYVLRSIALHSSPLSLGRIVGAIGTFVVLARVPTFVYLLVGALFGWPVAEPMERVLYASFWAIGGLNLIWLGVLMALAIVAGRAFRVPPTA